MITNAEMAKIKKNQKSVKNWSNCLSWVAYYLLAVGWVSLIGNVLFASVIGKFIPPVNWYDYENKKSHHLKIDTYGLAVMCFMKAAGSCFLIKQARATLAVFNPILKEYKDAESGRTQGIRMAERKSAKMMDLTNLVKRLTYGIWVFNFFGLIYCDTWMVGQVDRFIDAYYITKNDPNATFAQEFINVESSDDYWGPKWDDFDDDFGDEDSMMDDA